MADFYNSRLDTREHIHACAHGMMSLNSALSCEPLACTMRPGHVASFSSSLNRYTYQWVKEGWMMIENVKSHQHDPIQAQAYIALTSWHTHTWMWHIQGCEWVCGISSLWNSCGFLLDNNFQSCAACGHVIRVPQLPVRVWCIRI